MSAWSAALYCRLSKDDEDKCGGSSESIRNQELLLLDYAGNQGFGVYKVYADDGYSGTTTDRPAFKEMLKDIECKKVNVVITKDLSRLSRDYIETGHYLERYFPIKGVRYIAVTDGIDSFLGDHDLTPFKAVINDLYAKDISKKVRASLNHKRNQGQFIGAFAPYGYAKDKDNKNKLVIDNGAAQVVRRIFDMYSQGTSMSRITKILNEEKVPSPNEYKKTTGCYSNANAKYNIWRQQTVKSILSNPTYRGDLTQGRSVKVSYKSNKFRKVKKENWVVAKNTHEAVIDGELFDMVQSMLKRNASTDYGAKKGFHLLSGLLFCGDCGYPLTFRRASRKRFIMMCSNNARYGLCKRHQVYEEVLNNIVLDDLKATARHLLDIEAFAKQFEGLLSKKTKQTKQTASAVDTGRLVEIKNIIKNLYNDRAKGLLTDEDFAELMQSFQQERETIKKRLQALPAQVEEEDPLQRVREIAGFEEANKMLLTQLISKIEVFETPEASKEIKIHYNFKAPDTASTLIRKQYEFPPSLN